MVNNIIIDHNQNSIIVIKHKRQERRMSDDCSLIIIDHLKSKLRLCIDNIVIS